MGKVAVWRDSIAPVFSETVLAHCLWLKTPRDSEIGKKNSNTQTSKQNKETMANRLQQTIANETTTITKTITIGKTTSTTDIHIEVLKVDGQLSPDVILLWLTGLKAPTN